MRIPLLVTIAFLFSIQTARAGEIDWQLDKNHSEIGFWVRHLGLSKVRGRFKEFDAPVIKADAKTGKISAVEAIAKTASIDTDNGKRDDHLRSDDFFAAARHPDLRLELESIKWKGDDFTGQVTLTMRGVSKTVPFEGELVGTHEVDFGGRQLRAGYQLSAKISRKAFGLRFNKLAEGVAVVGDEVTIQIDVQIWRKL